VHAFLRFRFWLELSSLRAPAVVGVRTTNFATPGIALIWLFQHCLALNGRNASIVFPACFTWSFAVARLLRVVGYE